MLQISFSSFWLFTFIVVLLFSDQVVSDSLRPHGLQHARLSCSSLSPGVCANSCPLSWWCYPTISSSATHMSSYPQSLPSSESFPMSQLFASDNQSIKVSASATVLPVDIQGWFPLGFIGLILLSKGLSSVFSHNTIQNHQFFNALYGSVLISIHATGKTIVWIICTFVSKVMSLFFNMLSTFVIAFLPSVS